MILLHNARRGGTLITFQKVDIWNVIRKHAYYWHFQSHDSMPKNTETSSNFLYFWQGIVHEHVVNWQPVTENSLLVTVSSPWGNWKVCICQLQRTFAHKSPCFRFLPSLSFFPTPLLPKLLSNFYIFPQFKTNPSACRAFSHRRSK